MSSRSTDDEARPEQLLLACALAGWAVAALHLGWLLWKVVPLHCAVFEGLRAPLPFGARLVVAASNRFVRLLPLAILLGPVALTFGGAAAGLVAWRLDLRTRTLRRAGLALAIAGVSVTVLASFAVVHGLQSVYDHAAFAPPFRADE